jgi:nucleoside-diphosphate-sugar epimerase
MTRPEVPVTGVSGFIARHVTVELLDAGCEVRDVARMHRPALDAAVPSGGRYLGSADCLRLIDIARAIRAELGTTARRVPSRQLPGWRVRILAPVDAGAWLSVPELGLA